MAEAASEIGDEPVSELTVEEPLSNPTLRERLSLLRLARHTLGIIFLLVTVLLFTASNFLSSNLFADDSYSKPYFVTYVDSSFFSVFLIVPALKWLWRTHGLRRDAPGTKNLAYYSPLAQAEGQTFHMRDDDATQSTIRPSDNLLPKDNMSRSLGESQNESTEDLLSTRETAKLGFEFCLLWFLANYFVAAALEFTNVASVTVLTATSGIMTLSLGTLLGVETFTLKKLMGVLGTLTGVVLTSTVDLSGESDKSRGSFPHKSTKELAIGDTLAFGSAVMYAIYTTILKKKVGSESRVNMMLFFGFVGLFNIVALLPGLLVFHVAGFEKFEFPPTKRIMAIVLINAITSLVSDICWAYSMLLTSPLVVTVGLSMTIPLSLVGQIIINQQNASLLYWIGAVIVFVSFIFINHESKKEIDTNTRRNNEQIRHSRNTSTAADESL